MKNDKGIDKHGNEINDVIDKTINLYQYDYRDEMKEKIGLLIKKWVQKLWNFESYTPIFHVCLRS